MVTWCTTSLTFNNCTFCPHCIYVFCFYLRTNSDLYHLQHKLIGFYNRDEKCLQRGTDWAFKYSGLRFVFKGLNNNQSQFHTKLRNSSHSFLMPLPCIIYYFALWPTNAQLFHKLSHCYMFRHYSVILRESVVSVTYQGTNHELPEDDTVVSKHVEAG